MPGDTLDDGPAWLWPLLLGTLLDDVLSNHQLLLFAVVALRLAAVFSGLNETLRGLGPLRPRGARPPRELLASAVNRRRLP